MPWPPLPLPRWLAGSLALLSRWGPHSAPVCLSTRGEGGLERWAGHYRPLQVFTRIEQGPLARAKIEYLVPLDVHRPTRSWSAGEAQPLGTRGKTPPDRSSRQGMASHLPGIQQAVASLAGAQDEALTEARASVAKALHNCFHEVSSRDVSPDERKQIDLALSADATALKGALFKALKVCDLHRAFLGLPATLEATRLQLAAAPAKGVATYLEVDLCADIDACSSRCIKYPHFPSLSLSSSPN